MRKLLNNINDIKIILISLIAFLLFLFVAVYFMGQSIPTDIGYKSFQNYIQRYNFHQLTFGILSFFFLVNLLQYLILKEKVYIYYSLYLLVYLIYFIMFFNILLFQYQVIEQPYSYRTYYIPILLCSYPLYYLFVIEFLNLSKHVQLKIYFNKIIRLLWSFPIIYFLLALTFFKDYFNFHTFLIISLLVLEMVIGIWTIVLVFRIKDNLSKIIVCGSIFLFVGSLLGFLFSHLPFFSDSLDNELLKYPHFYTQAGVLIEVLFFSVGLAYRSKIIELDRQNMIKSIEIEKAKTNLFTNITHEFRTPLTVILGMTDKLEEFYQSEQLDKFPYRIDLIRRNGNRLLHLVNQILDLTKLESKSMSLNLIQNDIIGYLKYLMVSFQSLAESKSIRLHFSRDREKIMMDYDSDKIDKIITNLISNAIKFTPLNGIINVNIEAKEEQLQIQVKDTGIGISKNNLPFIFNRFYQVENEISHSTGSGIGLALTKEIVHLMEGEIKVNSIEGEGTTIAVFLPITNQAEIISFENHAATDFSIQESLLKENEQEQNEELSTEVMTSFSQLLIVEDNPDIISYLKDCLEDQYQIHTATDGEEGISKAIDIIPDIIISDVMMPKKDGYELCSTLKNNKRTSHIPIILLTAKIELKDKLEGLQRGADAYLAKPFNKDELLFRINKLIEIRTRLRMRYSEFSLDMAWEENENYKIEDEFVKTIRQLIEDNMANENFKLKDICSAVFLERSQVYRKLKALTGKSPKEFVQSIKMRHALKLILETDSSITTIAYDVGFKDLSHFSRVFTEKFKRTPSSFRK